MTALNKGDTVFIVADDNYKVNLGKEVRLLHWVQPGDVLNYNGLLVFHGKEEGGWIVTRLDKGNLVGKTISNETLVTNVGFYKTSHLDITKKINFLSIEEPATSLAYTWVLTEEEFAEFEKG